MKNLRCANHSCGCLPLYNQKDGGFRPLDQMHMGISRTSLLTLIKNTEFRNGDRRQTESDYVLVYSAKKMAPVTGFLFSARIGSPSWYSSRPFLDAMMIDLRNFIDFVQA